MLQQEAGAAATRQRLEESDQEQCHESALYPAALLCATSPHGCHVFQS